MVSDGVLRESMDWLLAVLTGEVPAEAVEAGFAPRLTEGRDLAGGLARRFAAFRGQRVRVVAFKVVGPARARAVVALGGREWEFTIAVESAEPHRISVFQPRPVPADAVAWPDVTEQMRDLDHTMSELPEAVAARFLGRLVTAAGAERVAGLCCGVLVDGEVVFQAYLGTADVRTLAPLDHASVFRVGSVTKLVTAYAVLELAEEGLLDLGAPLSVFVNGGGEATVEDLLLHRAGLPKDLPGRRGESGLPGTLAEAIGVLGPVGPVGERAEYSSLGYELLGLLVEQVTGEDFAERCALRVLGRFGMDGARLGGASALAPSDVVGNEVVAGKLAPVAAPVEAYRAAGGMTADLPSVLALARSVGRTEDPLIRALMGHFNPAGPASQFVPGGAVLSRAQGPMFWRGGSTLGFTAELVAASDGSAAVALLGSATPAPGLRAVAEGLLDEVRGLRRGA